jgi:acyl carrier protein
MSKLGKDEIFNLVVKHYIDTVGEIDIPTIKPEHSMKDLGASSMDIVEVVSSSMRELRVRVPRNELSELKNIGDLVNLLEKVVSEKEDQV